MKGKHLMLVAAMAAILTACDDNVDTVVVDKSFSVKADVEYEAESMTYHLYVTLDSGDAADRYSISWLIDGGHKVQLYSEDGRALANTFTHDFGSRSTLACTMGKMEPGRHSVSLVVSTDVYSKSLEVPFTVVEDSFGFHAEANTSSATNSAVLVSITDGRTDRLYSARITCGSDVLAKVDGIDFAKNPIASIPLPVMRPGDYRLHITMTDGKITNESDLQLKEPLRYSTINGRLSYDSNTGKVSLTVDDNPYGVSIAADGLMTVDGSCTVNLQTGYFHGGPKTQVCTLSMDEEIRMDAFVPARGRSTLLCNFSDLERRLAARTEDSYVWAKGYDPEKEEEGEWCLNFTEKKNYEVVSRNLSIRFIVEKIDGLKLVLSPAASWIHTTISYE